MSVLSSLRSGSVLGWGGDSAPPCVCASRWCAPSVHEQRRLARAFYPGEGGNDPAAPSVLVVFADHTECPWLRLLRRGFRHCFVVLRAGSVWLACDPLKDRIELDALVLPAEFDLGAFYREQGHRVLVGQRPPTRKRRPFALAPLTCVSVVKRLLGIEAPWVWTPWQLYSHLSGAERGFRPCQRESGRRAAPSPTRANAALDTSGL